MENHAWKGMKRYENFTGKLGNDTRGNTFRCGECDYSTTILKTLFVPPDERKMNKLSWNKI